MKKAILYFIAGVIFLVVGAFIQVYIENEYQTSIAEEEFIRGWCTEVVRHHEKDGAWDRIRCYRKFPEMEN